MIGYQVIFQKNLRCQLVTEPENFEFSFNAETNHYVFKRIMTEIVLRGPPLTQEYLFGGGAGVNNGPFDVMVPVVSDGSSSELFPPSSASSVILANSGLHQIVVPAPGDAVLQSIPESETADEASKEKEVDQGTIDIVKTTKCTSTSIAQISKSLIQLTSVGKLYETLISWKLF